MVKLLIINQHTSNRGDESALRGLLSKLDPSDYEVSILYNGSQKKGTFSLERKIKEYVLSEHMTRLDKFFLILTFFLPLFIIKGIASPQMKKEIYLIDKADLVVNSPGGANLGLYKDWIYLWRLHISKKLQKKVAVYSISFGPFPPFSIFTYLAKNTLKKLDFISLRDAQSFRYANNIGVDFIKSIDSAYLCPPKSNLPHLSLSKYGIPFQEKDFIVFVPNELNKWHPYFREIPKEKFDSFYSNVLKMILKSGTNVVFLPQLFGTGNDSKYFETLCGSVDLNYKSQIYIVDDQYNSDIQQKIVSLSRGVIGARYHSIVFSVNNSIPFICFSYEHKMENMLEILGLQEFSIPLISCFEQGHEEKYMEEVCVLIKRVLSTDNITIDSRIPQRIAQECFDTFDKVFLQNSKVT